MTSQMSRGRRPGGAVLGGTTRSAGGGLGAPGKRTLTQGFVQRKARAAPEAASDSGAPPRSLFTMHSPTPQHTVAGLA